MTNKRLYISHEIIFVVMLTILVFLIVSPAQAQCGDTPEDSSCITCHEHQGADPVLGKGEWHDIHARKDCCWNCHGGNTKVHDQELAHVGMTTQPLEDIYTDCHSCHPDDYQSRADRFAVALGVTPASSVTATPVVKETKSEQPIVIQNLPVLTKPSAISGPLIIGGVVVAGLLLLILGRRFANSNSIQNN